MQTKILIVLIVLIGLGVGGFFAWKNLSSPEDEKEKETQEELAEEQTEEQPEVPYIEVTDNEIKIIGTHTYMFFDKTELMQVAGTSKWPDSSETYINRAQERIEYFDKAYLYLQDLLDYTPFSGEKIGAKIFDAMGGGYGGGKTIGVGNYPYEDMDLDLQTYFHEMSHSFTHSCPQIYAFTEGRALFAGYYINLRLSQENSDFLFFRDHQRRTFVGELELYESYGSPFEDVYWDKSAGELHSSSIVAGMYIRIAERYGWENVSKLRKLSGADMSDDTKNAWDQMTLANFLVYQWRSVGDEKIVDMFLEWNFPLHIDSDEDGISDGEEIRAGNNPFIKG